MSESFLFPFSFSWDFGLSPFLFYFLSLVFVSPLSRGESVHDLPVLFAVRVYSEVCGLF